MDFAYVIIRGGRYFLPCIARCALLKIEIKARNSFIANVKG